MNTAYALPIMEDALENSDVATGKCAADGITVVKANRNGV
jgi:hypothetical protein